MAGGTITAWLMNLGFAGGSASVAGVSGTAFQAIAWSNSPADARATANEAAAIASGNDPSQVIGYEVQ